MRPTTRIAALLCSATIALTVGVREMHGQTAKPLWSIRDDADEALLVKPGRALLVGSDVLIVDEDAMVILRIDRTGKVVQRIGAKGSGPGEFRSIFWMGTGAGDSLYVWDDSQRRLSIFSAGKFVRSESPEHGLERPMVFGRLRDGRWLMVTQTEREFAVPGAEGRQTILQVGAGRTVREGPAKLIDVPSKRFVGIVDGMRAEYRELPAMDMTYLAGCQNGFLVGYGAQREIRAYDAKGAVLTTVRTLREPTIMEGAARTALIENWAGVRARQGTPRTDPGTAAAFAKAFDAAMPAKVQSTEQFAVGADGSLWLAPSRTEGWQLLGNDGPSRPLLDMPNGVWPLAIDAAHVLGRWYGDDARVELWPRPRTMPAPPSAALARLGTCTPALVR